MIKGEWTKSSFSNGSGGNNCVEVKMIGHGGDMIVRNSRRPLGEWVRFTSAEWEAFLAGVKAGEFDLPDGAE